MTEEEIEKAEEAVQTFLNSVREAYRVMRAGLTEGQFHEYARHKAQDNLSLFSPWMNKDD